MSFTPITSQEDFEKLLHKRMNRPVEKAQVAASIALLDAIRSKAIPETSIATVESLSRAYALVVHGLA
ncbi:hypothetical protein HLB23_04695 [Nocardia uniformis]|uniref:Uncharacterized protein n=1 Tax=Nocardia uniformis TaxID=53432 RepID=A0A849BRC6_9NOCA|nr:hypothetical protein [Nocardia uniformis]NNH69173.1 hypothetical protein [Nocardia uniformis]